MVVAVVRLLAAASLLAAPAAAHAAEPPIQRPSTMDAPAAAPGPAPAPAAAPAAAPAPAPAAAPALAPAPAAAPAPRREPTPPAAAPAFEPPAGADTDHDRRRRGAALGGAGLVVSLGASIGAGVLAHRALRPTCADANDPMTCEIPTGADLRQRGGLLGGAAVLSLAGAVLGGLGTRALMRNTGQDSVPARERRRTVATATGTGAVLLGVAGIATGIALTSVGFRTATRVEQPTIDLADPLGSQQAVMDDVDERLDGIRLAGVGLALALSAPTALTIGVALLRNRPARLEVARITPQLGPTYAGAMLTRSF